MKELELYIHIPFCMKKCNYCDFLSAPADEKSQSAYMEGLNREISFWGEQLCGTEITTIFIGGGTPTYLQEAYIEKMMEQVMRVFSIKENAEITMECNPGTLTESKLLTYKRAGINRLSIGLQSADDEELRRLGRIHTYEQFLRNYELARKAGFTNINIDLMHGLPGQSVEDFRRTLTRILPLKPEHISAYSLIIEQGTPFYETYKADVKRQEAGLATRLLPDEDTVYQITKMTQTMLESRGYEHYEISNFAKKGFRCRHNVGYWQRENYLGLGLGAASMMDNVRYTNLTDLGQYIEETKDIQFRKMISSDEYGESSPEKEFTGTNLHAQGERLSVHSQMEEFMFLGFRMMEGISKHTFYKNFRCTVDQIYGTVIAELEAEGLLVSDVKRICLTEKGNDLSNYVMAKFLL